MKLSQDLEKVLIPGRKSAYRLYGMAGWPLLDLLIGSDEIEPKAGERTLCRHPFVEQKRVAVIPSRVEKLHSVVFDKEKGVLMDLPTLSESAVVCICTTGYSDILFLCVCDFFKISMDPFIYIYISKQYVSDQIKCLRPDILRAVNPGQYKVSVSVQLFDFLHSLWQLESPVVEIC